MEELEQLKKLMILKSVERTGDVDQRKESTADHVYGAIILAEHFLKKVKEPLDELKVLKLLLYHDMVEIETGDVFILDEDKRKSKSAIEAEGAERLAEKIPKTIGGEFLEFFNEFEECKTKEAQFAKAIDMLEPIVHWALHTKDWTKWGFTEQNLRDKKERYMEPFPELLEFFNNTIKVLKEKKYI